jgi:hypothetical protein
MLRSFALVTAALLAAGPGDTLYVNVKDAPLLASTAPNAKVLALLQPGQAVTWLGADAENKQFHRVTVEGKTGVIFQSHLSPRKPQTEVHAEAPPSGPPLDPQVFVEATQASRARDGGAAEWPAPTDAGSVELRTLEDLGVGVTVPQCATHAKKAGLTAPGAAR